MGNIEHQAFIQSDPESEILAPHHFYAAYVFDNASERKTDIRTLIEEAQEHGYPVRYW